MKPSLENPRLTKRLLLEFSEQLFFLGQAGLWNFFQALQWKTEFL